MKYSYVILGLLFLGLGVVGVVMPFIPTTPFVLLAASCFGKSSDRLHGWLVSTRFYKNNVEGLVKNKTLTLKAKIKLLVVITVLMGLSFIAMRITNAPLVPQGILVVVWVVHMLYFGFKVKSA